MNHHLLIKYLFHLLIFSLDLFIFLTGSLNFLLLFPSFLQLDLLIVELFFFLTLILFYSFVVFVDPRVILVMMLSFFFSVIKYRILIVEIVHLLHSFEWFLLVFLSLLFFNLTIQLVHHFFPLLIHLPVPWQLGLMSNVHTVVRSVTLILLFYFGINNIWEKMPILRLY